MKSLKIMIVAGEASGDQYAADLARVVKTRHPQAEIFALGGDMLRQAGVEVAFDLVSHAVIGITEALHKIGHFFKALKVATGLLKTRRPDVLVLTDFPDLNFQIAGRAKRLGIPVVYFISPQIWAWRRGRIKTIKRLVDRMIVLFPFEEAIYREAGIPVSFVGHPLLDLVKPEVDPARKRQELLGQAKGPLVALLPGSRAQEIEFLLPVLAQAGKRIQVRFPEARLFIPLARTVSEQRVREILALYRVEAQLVRDQAYAARAAADLALVSSGTATLETAILGTPMLIGYRIQPVSYWLARLFVKIPYFGLANLAAGEKIAPEFLQHEFNAETVTRAALHLLTDRAAADAQRRAWAGVRDKLGGSGAAERAAAAVLKTIE